MPQEINHNKLEISEHHPICHPEDLVPLEINLSVEIRGLHQITNLKEDLALLETNRLVEIKVLPIMDNKTSRTNLIIIVNLEELHRETIILNHNHLVEVVTHTVN